jgi:hypothetical protein
MYTHVEGWQATPTLCFVDLGKLNLLIISLPWSKSLEQTVRNTRVCIGGAQY